MCENRFQYAKKAKGLVLVPIWAYERFFFLDPTSGNLLGLAHLIVLFFEVCTKKEEASSDLPVVLDLIVLFFEVCKESKKLHLICPLFLQSSD